MKQSQSEKLRRTLSAPSTPPWHTAEEQTALQMPRIVPAFELDPLGQLRVLALRAGGVGIASVRADQAVHHQLERRRDLIPVHRRNDHDAVSGDPHWIDLVHPVLGLAERM